MIDERQEELAALYVLDALEGRERLRFETQLAGDPELQRRVIDLRESAAGLAHAAAVPAPPELRQRILDGVGQPAIAATSSRATPNAKLNTLRTLFPWGVAACFAVIAVWFGQRATTAEGDLARQRSAAQLADLALRTARSLFDSERIVTQQQARDLTVQLTRRQNDLTDTLRLTTELTDKLADEIAAGRDKDERLAELTRRLAKAEGELAALAQRLRTGDGLANLKIATLRSMLSNSPEALAVVVWNPATQEGVFTMDKLPALPADQSYELWVIEAKADAKPVSAGVIAAGANDGGQVRFRPSAPVATPAKFAVSRERKDGAAAHAQPADVILISR